jgi:hypothetical protein
MFNINLHVDDLEALKGIAKILGIGVVTSDTANSGKYVCSYRINKQSELSKLEAKLASPLFSSKDEKDIITTSEIETLFFADPVSVPLNDGRLLNLAGVPKRSFFAPKN